MRHKRDVWINRIKASEREYRAVRIGLDWLLDAQPDEIHEWTEARAWDEMAVTDAYAADRHLDATYLIRMFSIFDRAVHSFWRTLSGNADRSVGGDVLLDEVGFERKILADEIRNAQDVRTHRNHLVHDRIEDHAVVMAIQDARHDLLTFLGKLPGEWD